MADTKNDRSRLKHHVLPKLGALVLADVRPHHIAEFIKNIRLSKKLAPKTIYSIYAALKAMFRDGCIAGLIESSPCILSKYQLGPMEDRDPEWRATAIFSRDELEMLISDDRVPFDRQVFYALQGIGALRHGEAAGLRWRHYDATMEPLGRFVVATSYDTGRTKAGGTRYMPVHPVLAAMLAEWRLHGWSEMMGRTPQPDDLVVPLPLKPQGIGRENPRLGGMRNKNDSWKRLAYNDLPALGLRHRRGHDLRRTMISLARTDGARKDILELCTHNPRKLKLSRQRRGQVVALQQAAVGGGGQGDDADGEPDEGSGPSDNPAEPDEQPRGLATRFATRAAKPSGPLEETQWRRRESKRIPGQEKCRVNTRS